MFLVSATITATAFAGSPQLEVLRCFQNTDAALVRTFSVVMPYETLQALETNSLAPVGGTLLRYNTKKDGDLQRPVGAFEAVAATFNVKTLRKAVLPGGGGLETRFQLTQNFETTLLEGAVTRRYVVDGVQGTAAETGLNANPAFNERARTYTCTRQF